jgi:type I restriction enzyme M protein
MTPASIVQKLWNYCNVLRDDGMSYGDYVEQLTYLLVQIFYSVLCAP